MDNPNEFMPDGRSIDVAMHAAKIAELIVGGDTSGAVEVSHRMHMVSSKFLRQGLELLKTNHPKQYKKFVRALRDIHIKRGGEIVTNPDGKQGFHFKY
jgi:hypothetical protein